MKRNNNHIKHGINPATNYVQSVMPDLRSLSRITMRGHPVIPLDSAIASQVPGFRRNDKRKVFIRRFNIDLEVCI